MQLMMMSGGRGSSINNKHTRCIALLSICLIIICSWYLYGAFEDLLPGARVSALCGGYTAISDDVYAMYYNPSGMGNLERTEVSLYYGKLNTHLDDNSDFSHTFLSVGFPVRKVGSFGFSWVHLGVSGLYFENEFRLSYGRRKFLLKSLSLGANFKILHLRYGSDKYTENAVPTVGNGPFLEPPELGKRDPLFDSYGRERLTFTMDIGSQYRIGKSYRFGFAVMNLLPANTSLSGKDEYSFLPVIFRTGASFIAAEDGLIVGTDFILSSFAKGIDWRVVGNCEKRFLRAGLVLRAGVGIGARNYAKLSFGVGYCISWLNIDYALIYPLSGIRETYGDHKVSLTVRFGPVLKEEVEDVVQLKKQLEKEIAEKQQLMEAYQATQQEYTKAQEEIKALSERLAAVEKKKVPTPTPTATQAQRNFEKELAEYNKKRDEMKIVDAVEKIKEIIDKYKKIPGVNVYLAEEELKRLYALQKKMSEEFKTSWEYYKKMVKGGAGNAERIMILKRMQKKYEGSGVDLSLVEEELKKLSE